MLRFLRQGGAGQILMAGIVFAIIVVFLLEFRSTSRMQTGSLRRECAARIDRECVTPKDFFAEFGLVVPRGMPQKQIKAYSLRKQVLDGVIERELLVAEAQRLGLGVDDEAVKKELRLGRAHASLPAASALRLGYMLDLVSADETGISRDLVRELPVINAKTQEIDDDLYARVVRSTTNRSPKEFMKMQARELLAARMRDLVRARVRVSGEEAFDAYVREKSKAVVRSVRLDTDWFAHWATHTSDAEVDAWAAAHQAEVDVAWKAEAPKWKADCLIGSELVAGFAVDTSEADKTFFKDKMDRGKSLAEKGVPFDQIAREVSDGPSAFTGGQLGCLTKEGYGEDGEALAKAVAALPPGSVSGVIETPHGYHVVRITGRLASADVESVGRRAVARPLAVRAASELRAREFATRLIQAASGGARLDDTVAKLVPEFATAPSPGRAVAGTATEKKAADAEEEPPRLRDPHAPKTEISAPFSADGDPVPGAFGVPLGRMAFELAKPDDLHPEPIAVQGGLIVLQLKEKTVATREGFDAVKIEILRRLQIAKRADALTRYVARLRQAKQGKIEISERLLEEPKTADGD
jgi:peptidyl-prolyl cis-trans isomerase D